MARFRLSRLAQTDLTHILSVSAGRWGIEGCRRYASLLAAAMRKVAAEPHGPATRARSELAVGLRSLHTRLARGNDPIALVRRPVHIVFFARLRRT